MTPSVRARPTTPSASAASTMRGKIVTTSNVTPPSLPRSVPPRAVQPRAAHPGGAISIRRAGPSTVQNACTNGTSTSPPAARTTRRVAAPVAVDRRHLAHALARRRSTPRTRPARGRSTRAPAAAAAAAAGTRSSAAGEAPRPRRCEPTPSKPQHRTAQMHPERLHRQPLRRPTGRGGTRPRAPAANRSSAKSVVALTMTSPLLPWARATTPTSSMSSQALGRLSAGPRNPGCRAGFVGHRRPPPPPAAAAGPPPSAPVGR